MQSPEQKSEIIDLYTDSKGKPYKDAGKIDYVAGWYIKAAAYIQNTNIYCAFVSTNSITQGTMASAVWIPLITDFNLNIIFGYRSFQWESESNSKATVHCVIIGFCACDYTKDKYIFDNEKTVIANRINQYLIDNDFIFVTPKSKTICTVPQMSSGGKPVEGGFLIFSEEEKNEFLEKEPEANKFFKQFMSSADYINGVTRWCLWLTDDSKGEWEKLPHIMARVNSVKAYRASSKKEATRKAAVIPHKFVEIKDTSSRFIVVPEVSSERRQYIPMGYLDDRVILSNGLRYIPDATLYELGVLTSVIHMSWTRTVCGRLEMRYDYSVNIVYNNFPWPMPSDEQKAAIEKTAQGILDARALSPDSSLADLYDPDKMPAELKAAHEANDKGKIIVEICIVTREGGGTYHLTDTYVAGEEPVIVENVFFERFPVRKNRVVNKEQAVRAIEMLYASRSLTEVARSLPFVNSTEETNRLIEKDAYIIPSVPLKFPKKQKDKDRAIKEKEEREKRAMQELNIW